MKRILAAETRQAPQTLNTPEAREVLAQDLAAREKVFDDEVEKWAGKRPAMYTPIEVAIDAWAAVSQEQRLEMLALRAELKELREKVERIDDEMLNGPESE